MSMIRFIAAVVLSVVAFQSVSHAEAPAGKQVGQINAVYTTAVDESQIKCLASNIYYESRGEPEEGKLAVGFVTMNRTHDGRFPSTICGVVHQKTKAGSRVLCQFSWHCRRLRAPNSTDQNWQECLGIARNLVHNPNLYQRFRVKYERALYFHEVHNRPSWTRSKLRLAQIGGHLFYADRQLAI